MRAAMGGETMIKIYPEIDEDDLLVRLFHKGVKAQWTVEDVDWSTPVQFSTRQSLALARLLTPVYLGEQSAMIGASVAMPQVAMAGETSAQLYLASFLMDEARHFEALTTLYRRLDYRPLSIREMPEMLQYHNRLRQGDRVDWVWGILISDIFAKNFYQMFAKTQPEALFGKLSGRILVDESRHQAFAEHYLKAAIPSLPPERLQVLRTMRDELLKIMERMYTRLKEDANSVGIDGAVFLEHLASEIQHKARRIGLDEPDRDDGSPAGRRSGRVRRLVQGVGDALNAAGDSMKMLAPAPDRGSCDTCFMALLCKSRLVRTLATT
jgi:hypothetical protein